MRRDRRFRHPTLRRRTRRRRTRRHLTRRHLGLRRPTRPRRGTSAASTMGRPATRRAAPRTHPAAHVDRTAPRTNRAAPVQPPAGPARPQARQLLSGAARARRPAAPVRYPAVPATPPAGPATTRAVPATPPRQASPPTLMTVKAGPRSDPNAPNAPVTVGWGCRNCRRGQRSRSRPSVRLAHKITMAHPLPTSRDDDRVTTQPACCRILRGTNSGSSPVAPPRATRRRAQRQDSSAPSGAPPAGATDPGCAPLVAPGVRSAGGHAHDRRQCGTTTTTVRSLATDATR
jgi:hypothetical protein